MGPRGFPGPPSPFGMPDDEVFPPAHWGDPQAAPPPWENLAERGAMPPGFAPELAGAPGAPPAEEPFPPPHWAGGEGGGPLGMQSPGEQLAARGVPEVDTGAGRSMQHQPTAAAPGAAAKAAPARPGVAAAGAAPGAGDDYATGMADVTAQRQDAIDRGAAAEQQQSDYRARASKQAAIDTQRDLNDANRAREDAIKAGAEKTRALTAEVDELGKQAPRANRAWADASVPSKIAAGVALFLGGMQSAFTGRNVALEAFQRIMDRDFEAQKEAIANKKDALGIKRGMLADELANGKDEYEAKVKHTLMGSDLMMKAIDSEAMRWNSPQIQAKADGMKAELQQATMGQLEEYKRYHEDKTFNQWATKAQIGVAQTNARTSRMSAEAEIEARKETNAARKAEADAKMAALNAEQQGRVILGPNGKPILKPDGNLVQAPDAKIALEERQKQAAGWAYYEELERYRKATEDMGREFGGAAGILGSTEARARAETMHKSLMMKYKSAEHLGALDKGAIEVFNAVVQPPSTWTSASNPAASADEARRVFKDTKNNEMRQVWGYSGNWVDDYESSVPKVVDAPHAKGNKQSWKEDEVLYLNEDGSVGPDMGNGRPLGDEEAAAARKQKAAHEAKKAPGGATEWTYRRQQNDLAARQGRALPFPEVGASK